MMVVVRVWGKATAIPPSCMGVDCALRCRRLPLAFASLTGSCVSLLRGSCLLAQVKPTTHAKFGANFNMRGPLWVGKQTTKNNECVDS
jgi:hypothetical protein